MKANTKFIITGITLFSFFALLTQCNSPVIPKEASVAVVSDTVIAVDSEKVVVKVDTIVARKRLTVIINNLASETAPVYVSLYDTTNKFLSKTDMRKGYKFIPHGRVLTAQISDMAYGVFAIATYQDVNDDGKCNTNLIGLPKEPYGFSNNYKPTIRAPHFRECQFRYDAHSDSVFIVMLK